MIKNINIVEASGKDSEEVAELVRSLLIELEPDASADIENMNLEQLAKTLLTLYKIWAFLAKHDGSTIGVITLHECAAIYAGGVFGEISELYVKPEYRSSKVGNLLIKSAINKGRELGWKRLEVGSPPPEDSPRTIRFYDSMGFKCTGSRLRCLIN